MLTLLGSLLLCDWRPSSQQMTVIYSCSIDDNEKYFSSRELWKEINDDGSLNKKWCSVCSVYLTRTTLDSAAATFCSFLKRRTWNWCIQHDIYLWTCLFVCYFKRLIAQGFDEKIRKCVNPYGLLFWRLVSKFPVSVLTLALNDLNNVSNAYEKLITITEKHTGRSWNQVGIEERKRSLLCWWRVRLTRRLVSNWQEEDSQYKSVGDALCAFLNSHRATAASIRYYRKNPSFLFICI